jgi:mannose-6-phosphate isomerase
MDRNKALLDFVEQPRIIRLKGRVQHYDWGGYDYIAELIREKNSDHKPYAELWMGAHPQYPSLADVSGFEVHLDALIAANPLLILGSKVAAMFDGKLPFLFKILDVRKMLSIQVHPSLDQARQGFERENQQGIRPDATERNYKDPFHKPELHIALTDFWMLHGFRPWSEILDILRSVPAFQPLSTWITATPAAGKNSSESLRKLYAHIMEMPQRNVDAMLSVLLDKLEPLDKAGQLIKSSPHYWARRAREQHPLADGHLDRGIFSIYLMNLINIPAGRGTFQPAQKPHAYLEGVTVELMANSDNVLRGGLTPKHVDVAELLKTLSFESGAPKLIKGHKGNALERFYHTDFDGFQLSRIDLVANDEFKPRMHHGPEIVIMLEGESWAHSRGLSLAMERGQIIFIPANIPYLLRTSRHAVLFRATVSL